MSASNGKSFNVSRLMIFPMGCNLVLLSMVNREVLLDNSETSTQLSHHLNELSPSRRLALILRATKIPSKKELLMSLPEAQLLDIMEETREVPFHFISRTPQ